MTFVWLDNIRRSRLCVKCETICETPQCVMDLLASREGGRGTSSRKHHTPVIPRIGECRVVVCRRLLPVCVFVENVGGAPEKELCAFMHRVCPQYKWLHLRLDALEFNGPARRALVARRRVCVWGPRVCLCVRASVCVLCLRLCLYLCLCICLCMRGCVRARVHSFVVRVCTCLHACVHACVCRMHAWA